MELFVTKNGTRDGNVLWLTTEREGWNRSLNKNAKNGTEQEDRSLSQNRTELDGTERERNNKKERERNELVEGPRSRTERNYFKKVGTCPALDSPEFSKQYEVWSL